jgi:hypothetical protein
MADPLGAKPNWEGKSLGWKERVLNFDLLMNDN